MVYDVDPVCVCFNGVVANVPAGTVTLSSARTLKDVDNFAYVFNRVVPLTVYTSLTVTAVDESQESPWVRGQWISCGGFPQTVIVMLYVTLMTIEILATASV